MDPPPLHVPDNNEYPESTNNIYTQTNPCNCNNCLSTLPYDNNTIITNNFITSANPPLIQQQFINNTNERTSSILEEQRIINEQQIIDHNNSQTAVPDTTVNSQTNYIELFKIEISGVEIIVRKKSLQNLNYNSEIQQPHQQNNEQFGSNLANRIGRIQNRMHPYQMPIEQNCKPNNINNNSDVTIIPNIPKQYYSCPGTSAVMTPQIDQQGHISDINQNYFNQ